MSKKMKVTNSLRYGSISLIATAVVLAIIIIVNLAVNAIPQDYTLFTVDEKGIYDISDVSRDYMEELESDITVYVVAVEGSSSEHHLMITEFLRRYAQLSNRITVKNIDPELYPNFVTEYIKKETIGEYDADDLSTAYTHLIVESEKRSMIVPYSSIFSVPSQIGNMSIAEFYYYYGYYPYNFKIENELLRAIDFVCTDTIPMMYYTSGHGELKLDDGYKTFAEYENILLKELSLTEEDFSDEARAVIIFAPTQDFTEEEIEKLKAFADRGGNFIVSTNYNNTLEDRDLPNFYSFLAEYYGLEYYDVMVFEEKSGNYLGYQNWIFPRMTSDVNSVITGTSGALLFTNAHALTVSENLPEGVTVTTLYTTTESGYAKTAITEDTKNKKEEGDIEGTFILGAMSERKSGKISSSLWWYSSTDSLSTVIDTQLANAYGITITKNSYLVIYTLIESVDKENAISIAGVMVTYDMLTISGTAANLWSVIIILVIPGIILTYGIYVRFRRIRR